MYTKRNYSLRDMIKWMRKDIFIFIIIGAIPVVLYSVLDFKWLHLPWLPIALIGTALAFIIGFKNNASYGRLWEARKIWGGIVNASRSFAIMANDFINNDHASEKKSDKELQDIRRTLIHRHIAWMTAHRYTLREPRPWEMFKAAVTNSEFAELYDVREWKVPYVEAISPYLTENDKKAIETKTNKATAIMALQSAHLRQLKKEGLIWEFSYLEMENILVEFYSLQGKNERIKNFPYPRQFATLNLFFVWIFICMLPFGIMNEFDAIGIQLIGSNEVIQNGLLASIYHFIAQNFVWLTVPFSVIISWVFYSMEKIGEVSENPFEGTANDVPITTMARGIEIDIRQIIGEDNESIPDPIESKYDILT